MIKLNIHQAKTHLSRYLKELKVGETLLLCRRNIPIAEVRSLPQQLQRERPLGLAEGRARIGKEFFDPLPKEVLNVFQSE